MFSNSHDFYINNLTAVEAHKEGKEFDQLEEAACLGAGHQSAERYDPPTCHPETRNSVLNDIMSWVNTEDITEYIMWMSGPAGAGKSAIAQTICERCHEENKLIASFFFSRTEIGTGRDNGNKLVPTLAYQIAITVPQTRDLVIDQLKKPTSVILKYTMEVQMQKLVLEPLGKVYKRSNEDKPDNCAFPMLVVVDGLDECNDPEMQSRIVRMIACISKVHSKLPLRFLIASRPELEIRNAFKSISAQQPWASIVLDEKYKPDDDIRTYLRSEFNSLKREHTLGTYLSRDTQWPSVNVIEWLVNKSSGQFIYASTIMKYLKHARRDPRNGLRSIIESKSAEVGGRVNFKESPYTALDQLYMYIMSVAKMGIQDLNKSITILLQVLLFVDDRRMHNVPNFSSFISMDEGEFELMLVDLHSILYVPDHGAQDSHIRFYHASFEDFLKDPLRSGEFHVPEITAHTVLARYCFAHIMKYKYYSRAYQMRPMDISQMYSFQCYFFHLKGSNFDDELLQDLLPDVNLCKVLHWDIARVCATKKTADRYNAPLLCLGLTIHDEKLNPINYHSEEHVITFESIKAPEIQLQLCRRIVTIVEEALLYRHLISVLEAIVAYLAPGPEAPSPKCCEHFYLNSERSLHLYYKLCEIPGLLKVKELLPFTLAYLIEKIVPSTIRNTELFHQTSKNTIYDILMKNPSTDVLVCVTSLMNTVDEVYLKAETIKEGDERVLCTAQSSSLPQICQ